MAETAVERPWSDDTDRITRHAVDVAKYLVSKGMPARNERPERRRFEHKFAKKEQARKRNLVETPIVKLLLGDSLELDRARTQDIINAVLGSIEARIESNPGMVLVGRTMDLYRINYAPDATDVSGVRSRLAAAAATDGYLASAFEVLLTPLVICNRRCFIELLTVEVLHCPKVGSGFGSMWDYYPEAYERISPVVLDNRKSVIEAVVNSVRALCQQLDPGSWLLQEELGRYGKITHNDQLAPQNHKAKEHARQWNLCDYESGLATELKACFEGGKRTSEEYEDLIERCLFRFGGANKRAMLGPGKLDTHPAYKAYKQNWSKRRAVDGRGDT